MAWDFRKDIPIWQQIATRIGGDIASGRYEPGSKFPSVRDLALEAGVNPNTMQKALTELERQGLLYSERTSGRFVTDNMQSLQQLQSGQSEEVLEEMFDRLHHLGMSDEQILEAVKQKCEANM